VFELELTKMLELLEAIIAGPFELEVTKVVVVVVSVKLAVTIICKEIE
jgi:hypothetical protein